MQRDATMITFSIRPDNDAWAWKTTDKQGVVRAQGAAPTKAIAAACVIRSIARCQSEESAAAAG